MSNDHLFVFSLGKPYLSCLRRSVHFPAHPHDARGRHHVFLCHPSFHGPCHQGYGNESVRDHGARNRGHDVHSRGHDAHNHALHDDRSPAHTCHPYAGNIHHDRDVGTANGHDEEGCDHGGDRGQSQSAKTQMEVSAPTNNV